jgi:hypothetical protein
VGVGNIPHLKTTAIRFVFSGGGEVT